MTEADLRKSIERSVLIRQVQQVDVTEKINVTDEEIRAFYDAHAREFTSPSEVMLREILIPVPATERGINVAQSDAAREQAEELRKRLMAGEPFPRLAAEFSAAASKNNDGGLVGPVKVDELNPALQDLVNGLKIGQISEVLSTTRGFQIFKLESRSETKVKTLEEARPDVSRRVAEGKYRGEMHEVSRTASGAGQDRLQERRVEEGLRESACGSARSPGARDIAEILVSYPRWTISYRQLRTASTPSDAAPAVVRHLDTVASRTGGSRAARTETDRGVSADDHEVEPLEGSEEEDRLAAVSGYCFARFEAQNRLPILKCAGVVSIVAFDGGEPAPIPDREIESIRLLLGSSLAFDPCPLIKEGSVVEVAHGPLKGVSGRLVRKNDKARLVLSVDLIGQAVSVEVDAADVRPA